MEVLGPPCISSQTWNQGTVISACRFRVSGKVTPDYGGVCYVGMISTGGEVVEGNVVVVLSRDMS